MLTTLEANFVQEYKICGVATEALEKAGFKAKSREYLQLKAHRLIKKPEIREILDKYQSASKLILDKPVIREIAPSVTSLPNKEQYALKAWERASDNSTLKEDTKHKYFETTGKVLGHLKPESDNSATNNFQIIMNELNLNISSPNQNSLEELKKNILSAHNISDENILSVDAEAPQHSDNEALPLNDNMPNNIENKSN